jgi:sirohydrochlorin ferrochelatase
MAIPGRSTHAAGRAETYCQLGNLAVRAPLLLGHGSPDPAACGELLELRELVAARLGVPVGMGVLEFPAPGLPDLESAFGALAGNGGVAAQPLLLFDGLHGRRDIPALAEGVSERLGLEVRLGAPFGRDPSLIDAACGRLAEAVPGDLLLFVGRGSSEPAALAQTREVAAMVAGRLGLDHLVCYTGISRPLLGEGIALALERRPRRVLALPYLLHTGVLVTRVNQVLAPLAAAAGVPLVVLPHIGNGPALVELLATRLEALL